MVHFRPEYLAHFPRNTQFLSTWSESKRSAPCCNNFQPVTWKNLFSYFRGHYLPMTLRQGLMVCAWRRGYCYRLHVVTALGAITVMEHIPPDVPTCRAGGIKRIATFSAKRLISSCCVPASRALKSAHFGSFILLILECIGPNRCPATTWVHGRIKMHHSLLTLCLLSLIINPPHLTSMLLGTFFIPPKHNTMSSFRQSIF